MTGNAWSKRFALAAAAALLAAGASASAQEGRPAGGAPKGSEFDSAAVKELAARAEALPLDDRIALVRRVRQSVAETLLTPDAAAWKGFEDLRGRRDAGLARILEGGLFEEGLLPQRGGGAYWSFTRRSHSYDEHPQIELQQRRFSSGFHGGACGIVATLEARSVRDVTEGDVPVPFAGTPDDVRKADRGGRWNPEAKTGQVYVVRTLSEDEFDVLAAFQVVARDDLGLTIAWRILREYDVPRRSPR